MHFVIHTDRNENIMPVFKGSLVECEKYIHAAWAFPDERCPYKIVAI